MASSESIKGLIKQQTSKQPKLVQLDKMSYKWLTEMHPDGKFVTGPTIEKQSVLMIK
jgi:hypothetical protein